MPSRKQRRRREKLQRHEWELVEIDEEGHETPLEPSALKKEEKPKAKPASRGGRRPLREVKPPSWTRAGKRAGLFAPLLIVFLSIGKNAPAWPTRIGIAVLYAGLFVPMFFLIDRFAYRTYRRRLGG
jgi:hypothetical protein